jgi:hypothetical protein
MPSKFKEWSDAAKMLNWLGIDFFEGFKVVIIDDMTKDKDG